jgi:hypothetical protein
VVPGLEFGELAHGLQGIALDRREHGVVGLSIGASRPLTQTVRPPPGGRRTFPPGDQHPGRASLPAYAAAARPLEDTEVVVWYTFGAHHVVRTEDWPVGEGAYCHWGSCSLVHRQ